MASAGAPCKHPSPYRMSSLEPDDCKGVQVDPERVEVSVHPAARAYPPCTESSDSGTEWGMPGSGGQETQSVHRGILLYASGELTLLSSFDLNRRRR